MAETIHPSVAQPSRQKPQVQLSGLPVFNGRVLTIGEVPVDELDSTDKLVHFARQLRGQFALIIQDPRQAIAITDPFGSYPVFYVQDASPSVRVSSRALELANTKGTKLSAQAIYSYVALGMNVTAESFFAGVHRLPRGSVLRISGASPAEIVPYFSWESLLHLPQIEPEEAKSRFKEHASSFLGAVAKHRPNGACSFSSGIDSALLVALMQRTGPDVMLRGYSIDYSAVFRRRYSEFRQASEHAHALGLDLERVVVRGRDLHNALERTISDRPDFPPDDRALPIQFLLSQAVARRQHTVCYTGYNADRAFGERPRCLTPTPLWCQTPTAHVPIVWADNQAVLLASVNRRRVSTMRPLLCEAGLSEQGLEAWVSEHQRQRAKQLNELEATDMLRLFQFVSEEENGLLWAGEHLPPEQAFGINFVSPFSDAEIIKLAFALPPHWLARENETKYFLRQLVREETHLLCDKRAFPSPMRFWALTPSTLLVCRTRAMRKLCQTVWARNVARLGRDYPLVYSFTALAAWLEQMSLC